MAAVVTRSHAPQRPLRKKRSFMSLHRDKSLDSKTEKGSATVPAQQSGYFNLYPSRAESKARRSESELRDRGPERKREDGIYAFPSINGAGDEVQTPRGSRTRQRSKINPPPASHLPPLRFSGSSALSHSPPATPTSSHPEEITPSALQQHIEVLMSAPIVETSTMDAFVDNMNGGEEDVFSTMEAMRHGRRRNKSNASRGFHHPLYHPPLPTPPPGVKLGVVGSAGDSDADDDDSESGTKSAIRLSHSRAGSSQKHSGPSRPRPASSRQGSTSTITNDPAKTPGRNNSSKQLPSPPASVSPPPRTALSMAPSSPSPTDIMTTNASIDEIVRKFVQVTDSPPKPVVPSISDIIRTHAPEHAHKKHKVQVSVTTLSSPPSPVPEDAEHQSHDDPSDALTRSSIDSIAEEVQMSLRASRRHPAATLHHARSFPRNPLANTHRFPQDSPGIRSPRSDEGHRPPSASSFSTSANTAPPTSPPISFANLGTNGKADLNHALATFLRSPRLTKLLTLKRSPNSRLQVSLSDLGCPTGKPVVVFLGLGCVRYIMGLYDEMAEALGLRLITIDRWGLGRTGNPPRNSPRGVMEWASVVEEVLDRLNIDRCSIMAHSAGAPYAMAFANRSPDRVQGNLCLLAPWVGAGEGASGYKWLKYVPTGLIKTAQAAEWKVQAWMLGKPPAIAYTGIGYEVDTPVMSSMGSTSPRPSLMTSPRWPGSREDAAASFSDYDDLADFQGRYASRSTVHINEGKPRMDPPLADVPRMPQDTVRNRVGSKSGRFFSGLWKGGESSGNSSPAPNRGSPKLKALKSMSSLRGRNSAKGSPSSFQNQTCSQPSPVNGEDWDLISNSAPHSARLPSSRTSSVSSVLPEAARGHGRSRRSISLSSTVSPSFSRSPSLRREARYPPSVTASTSYSILPGPSSAAIGNALLAASHAESSKGTHADLLQILNHNQKPWGFSYNDFPLPVKVWYGDKDEKIAEGAVRWMEKTMRPGLCDVCIVKGVGHALMYNGGVVVEALEFLKEAWEA